MTLNERIHRLKGLCVHRNPGDGKCLLCGKPATEEPDYLSDDTATLEALIELIQNVGGGGIKWYNVNGSPMAAPKIIEAIWTAWCEFKENNHG